MLKTELKVESIGLPNIRALSDSEQRAFFETLFSSIMSLYQKQKGA